MGTLKINWWIASITAILLLFGAFVVVNAVEKSETNATKTEATAPAERPVVMDTWYFTGSDPTQPSHYSQPPNPPSCDAQPETICSIEAENNGGVPLLTSARLADIQEVLEAIDDEDEEPVPNNTVKSFRSL